MGIGAARKSWGSGSGNGGGRRRGTLAGACAAAALLCLAAFPSLAAAVTQAPLLGPVTATPTMTGATLSATIYPYGAETHYRFEYGPTATYGTSVPMPDGSAGAAAFPTAVTETQTYGEVYNNPVRVPVRVLR